VGVLNVRLRAKRGANSTIPGVQKKLGKKKMEVSLPGALHLKILIAWSKVLLPYLIAAKKLKKALQNLIELLQ